MSTTDIWGLGPAGNPTVFHWDGRKWLQWPDQPLVASGDAVEAIAARGAKDVWAVGIGAMAIVYHWDGHTWRRVLLPNGENTEELKVVTASRWGIWAAGQTNNGSQLMVRWDGRRWQVQPSPPYYAFTGNPFFTGLAIVSATDAWAVGAMGSPAGIPFQNLVEHWDGHQWRIVPWPRGPADGSSVGAVVALSAHDVWAFGMPSQRWDGMRWRIVSIAKQYAIVSVAKAGPHEFWAAGPTTNGRNSVVLHFSGPGC